MAMFERLERQVLLVGSLHGRSRLHIGIGRNLSPTEADLPVVRDLHGRPFIPGSSLKGTLRAGLEAWLRGLFPTGKRNSESIVCDLVGNRPCISREQQKDWREKQPHKFDALLWQHSCWVCQCFGAPWLRARVSFADSPVEDPWEPAWLRVWQGVAIDRESGTAREKALYDLEAVPGGIAFRFEALVENPEDWHLGLLSVGFRLLNEGLIRLGGDQSRGLGRVCLEVKEVQEVTPQSILAGDREAGRIQRGEQVKACLQAWEESLREYLAPERSR